MAAIIADGLTKSYDSIRRRPGVLGGLRSLVLPERTTKRAVDDVSFSVDEGELFALLGPNGAGKSTTIKLLTGILIPDKGRVSVVGLDPQRERVQNARNIGAVFGQRTQLWWDLPVRESFSILRDIYRVPVGLHAERLREFDELLALSAFWDTRVRHLSLGQRVRCDVAAALLHDPMVVFLDEPTIGMDVVVKEQVREFLRFQVDKRGRTVVLTTHDMAEVSRLAQRMVLIDEGRMVFDGSLDELRQRYGDTWQVHVTLAEESDGLEVPGIRVVRREGARVSFGPREPAEQGVSSLREGLRRIIERYAVTDLAIEENDLEDVMRRAYLRQRD